MWILDSSPRGPGGRAVAWGCRGEGKRELTAVPSFLLHLPDPHAHRDLLEGLADRYQVGECRFSTVYGPLDGYRVAAGREVAERIEAQTRCAADLYNVDVRLDQRAMAEAGLVPCSYPGESRFALDFPVPLQVAELEALGNPCRPGLPRIEVRAGGRREVIEGPERVLLEDLFSLIGSLDPDVILAPCADIWIPRIISRARELGIGQTLSRSGRFRSLAGKSYWSYGRVYHKDAALVPEGRVLVDTDRSFVFREGGLPGVLMASRLSGLPPNLTARFTPGTLISSYEVYEALRRGIAVPFRKRDAEVARGFAELASCDKGGMIFQPHPGVYTGVHELDFTSLYPAIIVKFNLSPEVPDGKGQDGFLASVLAPLLDMRIRSKQLKKASPSYAGVDSVLKWMLVTCFGYTGYKNAKFGRIEVHEGITSRSREILLSTKEIAEDMGLTVIHGMVDCVWVQGGGVAEFKERVEAAIGIPSELDTYRWITFLPLADGHGAYNRYYGRMAGGEMKVRGIAARRGDTPAYLRRMQEEMLGVMGGAEDLADLRRLDPEIRRIHLRYADGLARADPKEMVVRRRVSRLSYSRRSPEASAVAALQAAGVPLAPGMEIGYVVTDASRWLVDVEGEAGGFDRGYYAHLLEKAWDEVAFTLDRALAQDHAADEGKGLAGGGEKTHEERTGWGVCTGTGARG
ncbi:MAG TPA: type B DNA-directed DNA polymerase [Methanomicrobiales archaeon]|nr:type B DNA-directed DNA polymerase [Methanomicrobiales archaeon]